MLLCHRLPSTQAAEEQLTIAVDTASDQSWGATGTELGRHQYMLGRVYYELGGAKRTNKMYVGGGDDLRVLMVTTCCAACCEDDLIEAAVVEATVDCWTHPCRRFAHDMFLQAANHEGPHQAAALAWMGRWYHEVANDEASARRCFQRALALEAKDVAAGALGMGWHGHVGGACTHWCM